MNEWCFPQKDGETRSFWKIRPPVSVFFVFATFVVSLDWECGRSNTGGGPVIMLCRRAGDTRDAHFVVGPRGWCRIRVFVVGLTCRVSWIEERCSLLPLDNCYIYSRAHQSAHGNPSPSRFPVGFNFREPFFLAGRKVKYKVDCTQHAASATFARNCQS